MIIWVVGAGGLLGSGIVRRAREQGLDVFVSSEVPWSDTEATVAAIRSDAQTLRTSIIKSGDHQQRWAVVWAAGRATTASNEAAIQKELCTFQLAVHTINEELFEISNGTFVLASSAGGVYAGSERAPFSSESTPTPLGAYGHLKLAQERAAREILSKSIRILIARFANLYGPGQDLNKLQGLISQLALTSLTRKPLTIFVPLDTLRDYITADDAARRLLHWVAVDEGDESIRVIASGQAVSIGHLIRVTRNVARTPIPTACGIHASAALQSADLRLIPDTDAKIKEFPLTQLPVGVQVVYSDILRRAALPNHHAPSSRIAPRAG